MRLGLLIILVSLSISSSKSRRIPVFYLNSNFDYRNMADYSRPDIDCLHTTGQNFSFPSRMTICLRHLHYTFGNTVISSYASGFGFGTMNSDWTDMSEGLSLCYLSS